MKIKLKILAASLVVSLATTAQADLFMPLLNAESYGRAGAGSASLGSSAAIIENPAGLSLKVAPRDNSAASNSTLELAIAYNDAIQLDKKPDDELFTTEGKVDFAGGFHFENKRYGWGLATGHFGSSLRFISPDSEYEDINEEIKTQYYAAGLAINLLPKSWQMNFNLGVSYALLPKAGNAIILGVQTKLLDTTNHSFSLAASQRSFTHADKDELTELYSNFQKASIDLPDLTSLGASWLIKGFNSSYKIDVDYKIADYKNTLHLKDLANEKEYGNRWASNKKIITSWDSDLHNLGEYTSQHLAISKIASKYTLTLGAAKGHSADAKLDSSTFGLAINFAGNDGIYNGLGVQMQTLEVNDKKNSLLRLVYSLGFSGIQ